MIKLHVLLPAFIFLFINTSWGQNGKTRETPGSGEFDRRYKLALDRLLDHKMQPVFTEDFVLADVNINKNNPRRFYNFSGDLSGRYLETLSLVDHKTLKLDLRALATKLISFQAKDGRFGDSSLVFSEKEIGPQQMALLWGNGRLLIGLLEYYKNYKDPAALAAAQKLGDFYLKIWDYCSSPVVIKKLEGMGATGIICFTQYIEGLATLAQITGNNKYAITAANTYTLLPKRGNQHSHGYLATLRGVLKLFEYTGNANQLSFVKNAYDDLVNSEDFTSFGSVREYFGRQKDERDEGCSTADFVRLSFHLYKLTGSEKYLEYGEFALYNAFYFNQYYTGDFGHHLITDAGARPDYLHASWWCCTMHCLRAMQEIKKRDMLGFKNETYQLNLYVETTYEDERIKLVIDKKSGKNPKHYYQIRIKKWLAPQTKLALRIPSWADHPVITFNGKPIPAIVKDNQVVVNQAIGVNDIIVIGFDYKLQVLNSDKKRIDLAKIQDPIKGKIFYGPYLLGVDDKLDPVFTAEPNANTIYSQTIKATNGGTATGFHDGYLKAYYAHGGYPSYAITMLRPISEMTFSKHGYMLFDFLFVPRKLTNHFEQDNSMIEPWKGN
jgi:hypothetical protein